ncbi:MAG: hypothetical protein PHH11_09575 [Methylomonas sp.]|nr:hypothetical protein [Methylomonas sp.]
MIVLRHPNQLSAAHVNFMTTIIIASLSGLLQQRFAHLGEGVVYDPDEHGYMVLVEPGDDVKALETATGCPILSDWFGDSHYGDSDYAPSCEWLDEYPLCFEMGFVLNDSGTVLLLIVPKLIGVDGELLSMCRENAELKTD